jgi:hypothetical protein
VFSVPFVKAATKQVELGVPALFGVKDKAILINILAQHYLVAASGLENAAETGRQENSALAVCLCFYVAYETHILPLK